ncbi:MAG: M48 family metalloprotease [Planctomycetes bacterium]|nr:M48 family metalloprotease [Planctomycetota bacterium]
MQENHDGPNDPETCRKATWLMPFIYLLLFSLICLQPSWPKPFSWPDSAGCAILVGTLVVTSWLSAGLIARTLAWQMRQHPERRGAILRSYVRWRRRHFIALIAGYLIALYLLGWGKVLADGWVVYVPAWLHSRDNLPGFHVVLILPFFLSLVASWERFYGVEKPAYELGHTDDVFISKANFLLMQIRHQFFLVVAPMALMVLLQVLYIAFAGADEDSDVPALMMLAIIGMALILMPWLLRIFLGLKPLPPGPLRDRLESAAHRLRFRFSNILVWNTRNLMANALVTGFVPSIRYVILTDRLIDELTPEEIESVFGHEVGHVKHHHLLFYLAFFLTSFLLLSVFWELLKGFVRQDEIISWLRGFEFLGESRDEIKQTLNTFSSFGKLAILGGYTLLCFGFVSRRCERQADLFGSTAVSTDVFINALEKVAAINGIPRDRAGNWLLSWQHPTIAQRVDFLLAMRDNPLRVTQFHRSIALLKWSFFLALGFLSFWFGAHRVWELLKEF